MKFDHIGIIVNNISTIEDKFKETLKLKNFKTLIIDKKIDVKVKFFNQSIN